MDILDAINVRCSRRTYLGGVPERDLAPLEEMCRTLGEEYGVYIKLEPRAKELFGGFSKSYGLFKGVEAMFALGMRENDEHGYEKLGHAGERLVLECTARGLGTCWVGGSFDRAATGKTAPEGVNIVAVITVGAVAAPKGKEKLLRGMMHRKSKTAAEMSEVEGTPPEWFAAGMSAVVKAPSAVNGQPVTVRYTNGRVTAGVPATRNMQLIDLGIAKLHFELGAGSGRFAPGNGGEYTRESV